VSFLQKITSRFSRKNGLELSSVERATWGQRIDRIVAGIVGIIILAYPLLFVPILTNAFDLPKNVLLVVGAVLAITFWLLRQAAGQKLNLARSPFDLPVILLAGVLTVSSLLAANRTASLTADTLVLIGAVLLFFLITQTITKQKLLEQILKIFLGVGVILAVWVILQTGIYLVAPYLNNPLLTNRFFALSFSPTGNNLTALLFLVALLPLALGQKKPLVTLVLLLGVGAAIFSLSKFPPMLMPAEAGWKVAAGTISRSGLAAIFGVGAGNFVDAATLLRPAELNMTSLWNIRFFTSSNYYFYLMTIGGLGVLGVLGYLILELLTIAKKRLETPASNPEEKGILGSLLIILALWAILPGNNLLVVAFFILLGLLVAKSNLAENLNLAKNQTVNLPANPWLGYLPGLAGLILTGFLIFNFGKLLLADYYFAKSLEAASKNLGGQAYNLQIKALDLAPDNDSYRLVYAQTNLALADNLAGQPNLSDQQKQVVVQLVQQAIREGQKAVALAPNRAANLENLSLVYKSLINFAQGADQWAAASLQQAINFDPTNPGLRLNLGGIYFANKDFLTAAQIFNQAVNLKPDLPNARYNLALALKNLNMKTQAQEQLQIVSSLVCDQTPNNDCDQVNKEIAEFNAPKIEEPPASPSGNLKNLPKAKTTPPAKIASPSGEITP
jgi:tetratricopeptide (TPR) repeat protein